MSPPSKALPPHLETRLRGLKQVEREQRRRASAVKNRALLQLAEAVQQASEQILAANREDIASLKAETTAAFRDRLTLSPERIAGMITSLNQVAALPDPVGEIVEDRILKNGLRLQRVRAPLGMLFMIFEARPNVILEAFSLAFKAGNVILLRGSSESLATSHEIYKVMDAALGQQALSPSPFFGLEDYDRKLVDALLHRSDLIDVVIPRGGDKLIQMVQKTATMPVIKNDRGLCHAYIDATANLDMALKIVVNGKTQRPGVCNALETVLVHAAIAEQFLPRLFAATDAFSLQWHVDAASHAILKDFARVDLAKPEHWDCEYLDLILNCAVVSGIDQALAHIDRHGSRHSEVIVTANAASAQLFLDEVDAAAVYWNASTRFTDGFALGLGAELGISTQKLHVRGPVGLQELTCPRWIIQGTGQIRD